MYAVRDASVKRRLRVPTLSDCAATGSIARDVALVADVGRDTALQIA